MRRPRGVGAFAAVRSPASDLDLTNGLRIHDPWFPARAKNPRESLCLPELYAITVACDATQLPGRQELPRWRWRALGERGWLQPATVYLPPLPDDASPDARATYAVIGSLLKIRWLGDPSDKPIPLSAPFMARWAGAHNDTDENTIRNGKRWLEKNGFLERVGEAPGRQERPTVLWLIPGAHSGTGSDEDRRGGQS